MPECISDFASLKSKPRRKSLYFFFVSRYVLTLISSVFLPTITSSWIDQYFSCPSQPSRFLPLNSLIVSRSPLRGGTIGGSFLSSAAEASVKQSAAIRPAAMRDANFMVGLLWGEIRGSGSILSRGMLRPAGEQRRKLQAPGVLGCACLFLRTSLPGRAMSRKCRVANPPLREPLAARAAGDILLPEDGFLR